MDLDVYTYHFGNRFQLIKIRELFDEKPVKSDRTYLLYQWEESSYIYIKDFGCATFINVPEKVINSLIEDLNKEKDDWVDYDTFKIIINKDKELSVDFDTITIPTLDLELMHIIALNLAQSSALNHYQSITDELLEETREVSNYLEKTGEVKLTRKRLAKYIGQTMSLRNRIADNLYIFEAPPLAWTDARLSQLDTLISEELDFENRHRGMQASLNVIRENHEFYKDVLQHKHSSMLEWIIIILILFEVVQIFID
ncbi:MAG: putative Rmd1/YagE family protein [Crocinitomicaceae bacterium]